MSDKYKHFNSIELLLKHVQAETRVLYVTPDIEQSAMLNPYLKNLYAPLSQSSRIKVVSISPYRFFLPPLRKLLFRETSVWHQHWFQFTSGPTLFRSVIRLAATWLYHIASGQVVWTVHNEDPHVKKMLRLNRLFRKWLSRHTDWIHVHNRPAAEFVESRFCFPPSRILLLPHPKYEATIISPEQCRAYLSNRYGLVLPDGPVFLVFGLMARYKRILELIEIFKDVQTTKSALIIAGDIRSNETDYLAELQSAISGDNIHMIGRFIPEEDIPYFMGVADYVVFNYRRILTSGAIQMAYDYHKKMIVPNVVSLKEYGGSRVTKFSTQKELSDILNHLAKTSDGANA